MRGWKSVEGPGVVVKRRRDVRRWAKRPFKSRMCQTKGKLLRFRRAKMRARNFQTPALPAKPSLLRKVDNVGAIA